MQAFAYIRVSSLGQDYNMQAHAIAKAAALAGDVLIETFAEKVSANTLKRPELKRLRAVVRAGQIKRLYVFKLDRLARSGIADTFEVIKELREHRCDLVPVDDPWFTLSGPASDMLIAALAWGAQMENLRRSERQAAARQYMQHKGGRWGRPPRMTKEQVEAAQQRRARPKPQSWRGIARDLKVPIATLHRTLKQAAVPKSSPKTAE